VGLGLQFGNGDEHLKFHLFFQQQKFRGVFHMDSPLKQWGGCRHKKRDFIRRFHQKNPWFLFVGGC
jgi:hypothetical protein